MMNTEITHLQITANDLKLDYGKCAKFSSRHAIRDIVNFNFCNYLPPVEAVVLMANFDGTKVLYTIGVSRSTALEKDVHYQDGMLLHEFLPTVARPGYLSTGYSKFNENEECDLVFNLFYNVVSDRIVDLIN